MTNKASQILEHFSSMTPVRADVEHSCAHVEREDGTFVLKDGKRIQGHLLWYGKAVYTLSWEFPDAEGRFIKGMKEGCKKSADDFCNTELSIVPDYINRDSAENSGCDAFDINGNAIEQYEDLEGDGDTEVIKAFPRDNSFDNAKILFKNGRNYILKRTERIPQIGGR